ncbi:hypothetical protein ACXZ7E_02685 [Paenibacillus lautus]
MKKRPKFKITEINGTKSPHEWFARNVQKYAKERYGMAVTVEVINRSSKTMETRHEKEELF